VSVVPNTESNGSFSGAGNVFRALELFDDQPVLRREDYSLHRERGFSLVNKRDNACLDSGLADV